MRIERFHLDTTYSISCNNCKSHVTSFTPTGTPWVSHQPVFSTSWSTPANNVSCVVKVNTTACIVKDTWGVELETKFVCLNCYREGSNSESCFHLVNIVGCYVCVAGANYTGSSSRIVLAGSVNSFVWIGRLWLSSVSLVVDERFVLPTTIASVVFESSSTINKLLLWISL